MKVEYGYRETVKNGKDHAFFMGPEKIGSHNAERLEVRCHPDCGLCCTEMPIAVTLHDIEILAEHHGITPLEFFDEHCIVYPATSVNTEMNCGDDQRFSYLSIGLPPPCPFLRELRCSLHKVRPMICRIFPLNIYANDRVDVYNGTGYPCMDQQWDLTDEQHDEYIELFVERNQHHWELFQKLPALEAGIHYDDQIIELSQELESRLPGCVSSEERAEVLRKLMDLRIMYGMEHGLEKVRKEFISVME